MGGHGLELHDGMGKHCSTLAGDAAFNEEGPEPGEAAVEVGTRVKFGSESGESLASGFDF